MDSCCAQLLGALGAAADLIRIRPQNSPGSRKQGLPQPLQDTPSGGCIDTLEILPPPACPAWETLAWFLISGALSPSAPRASPPPGSQPGGLLCNPPKVLQAPACTLGAGGGCRGHTKRGAQPLMSNRPSLEPRFHSAAAAPHPRPAGAPQIRLVFVPRTQCEKMSPRGRAPCPSLDNRPLNHQPSSSLFPSLAAGPSKAEGMLRDGGRGDHLLGLSLLPAPLLPGFLSPGPPIRSSLLALSIFGSAWRLAWDTGPGLGQTLAGK